MVIADVPMSREVLSLIEWLRQLPRDLTPNAANEPINIVLGNRGADLDSTVSALVLGWIIFVVTGELTYPVINIPAREWPRRRLVRYWIEETCRISPSSILFFRDSPIVISIAELVKDGNVRVHLVDHNVLDPEDSKTWESVVFRVIDHHVDFSKTSLPTLSNRATDDQCSLLDKFIPRKLITGPTVGSCATLMAGLLTEMPAPKSDSLERGQREASLLCLGAIIRDTKNCKKKLEGVLWSEGDKLARNALRDRLNLTKDHCKYIQSKFDDIKNDWKTTLHAHGFEDTLSADLKRYEYTREFGDSSSISFQIGYASFEAPLPDLLEEVASSGQLSKAILDCVNEHKLDAIFLMSTGGRMRHLHNRVCLIGYLPAQKKSTCAARAFKSFFRTQQALLESARVDLQELKISTNDQNELKFFSYGTNEPKWSRKNLEGAFREFVASMAEKDLYEESLPL